MPNKPQDKVRQQPLALHHDLLRGVAEAIENDGQLVAAEIVPPLAGPVKLIGEPRTFGIGADDARVGDVGPVAVDDFGHERLEPEHARVVRQLVFGERLLVLFRGRHEYDERREGEFDEPLIVVAQETADGGRQPSLARVAGDQPAQRARRLRPERHDRGLGPSIRDGLDEVAHLGLIVWSGECLRRLEEEAQLELVEALPPKPPSHFLGNQGARTRAG